MSGYRSGLTGVLLAYSEKKYRGHRAIPANVRDLLGELASDTLGNMPNDVRFVLANEQEEWAAAAALAALPVPVAVP